MRKWILSGLFVLATLALSPTDALANHGRKRAAIVVCPPVYTYVCPPAPCYYYYYVCPPAPCYYYYYVCPPAPCYYYYVCPPTPCQ